jgi:hypothetical protein
MDDKRTLLRHVLGTIAYRGGKTLRDAPPGFAGFKAGDTTRSPAEILAHIGDLFEWALSAAKGAQVWKESMPLEWDAEVHRFFATLASLDAYFASDLPLGASAEQLFQGPLADALTHVGQMALLRRLAGASVKGENYFKADIAVGRVGASQAAPRREF